MKITRKQLRKIIKETILNEASHVADIPQEMLDRINAIKRSDLQDGLWDIVDAIDAGVGHYDISVLAKNIAAAERMDF